jgi:hypothetical protein
MWYSLQHLAMKFLFYGFIHLPSEEILFHRFIHLQFISNVATDFSASFCLIILPMYFLLLINFQKSIENQSVYIKLVTADGITFYKKERAL